VVWAILGLIPAIAGLSWRWQLAGFGWSVPGGGFLALGGAFGILMFILTLVLMLLAIVAWWLTGYAPFPFLIWGIMLVLPITVFFRDSKWQFPVIWLILGTIVLYFILTRIHNHNMEKRSLKKQKERVEYFKEEIPAELAMAEPEVADDQFELTEEQLRMQKHLFDLTFGPFGEFRGFTKPKSSQIPLPALRYQINSMQNGQRVWLATVTAIARMLRNIIEAKQPDLLKKQGEDADLIFEFFAGGIYGYMSRKLATGEYDVDRLTGQLCRIMFE
jgi:Ca2+/Na+ antiporter